jgi:hypothetical protein
MELKKVTRIIGIIMVVLVLAVSGCAFGKIGKATMSYTEISVPSGLMGQGKVDVIKTLGVPESIAKAGDTEYWGYSNKCGYYVLLFGQTKQKDVVLEFKDGKVAANYLVDKGSSMGIFTGQGTVGN